jgi:transposase
MFSYVSLEDRVPARHPLRLIRGVVDEVLRRFRPALCHDRPPVDPPEQVLKALLLQAFYSVRSERQLMEQLDYNLLFRWFVGLGIDDAVWHPTVFSKNRDRLLAGDIA